MLGWMEGHLSQMELEKVSEDQNQEDDQDREGCDYLFKVLFQ